MSTHENLIVPTNHINVLGGTLDGQLKFDALKLLLNYWNIMTKSNSNYLLVPLKRSQQIWNILILCIYTVSFYAYNYICLWDVALPTSHYVPRDILYLCIWVYFAEVNYVQSNNDMWVLDVHNGWFNSFFLINIHWTKCYGYCTSTGSTLFDTDRTVVHYWISLYSPCTVVFNICNSAMSHVLCTPCTIASLGLSTYDSVFSYHS